MEKTILVDTNIIVRYLLKDDPILFKQALLILKQAKDGKYNIYIDATICAEVIWLFSSFYKLDHEIIASKMQKLLSQTWLINSQKALIMQAIDKFSKSNLSYIDCWLYTLSKEEDIILETFDQKLKKLSRKLA